HFSHAVKRWDSVGKRRARFVCRVALYAERLCPPTNDRNHGKMLAVAPDAPTSAGAPRRTGRPSTSIEACTDTQPPATAGHAAAPGGQGAATLEPIRGSSGSAIRHPSTRKEESCDNAPSLGK